MDQRARTRLMASLGGAAGLGCWLFDNDFLLNAGGPASPVSTGISRLLQIERAPYPVPVLVPLLILLLAGFLLGLLSARVLSLSHR